jgi:hypothetical protein
MLVTCYYDIYNKPARFWEYFDLFYDLAASGLPIIVFTDPTLLPKFRFLPPTVIVIGIPLEEFEIFKIASNYKGKLPEHRDIQKDTAVYMGLQNTKIEFIKRAKEMHPDVETWMWVDFAIKKVVPNEFHLAIDKIQQILNHGPYSSMIIGGCWEKNVPLRMDRISWRFAGGFFMIPSWFVDRFYDHCYGVVKDLCTLPQYCLLWEVSVWKIIESCADDSHHIRWYKCDHDRTIFTEFPLE